MTNTRKTGKTGLSILDIKPSNPPKKKKTPDEVAKWCATLPMADTGVSAKKLFMMQEEISQTEMSAKERFAVMELLRSPNKSICTSLKRHYIEQRAPLTENKLIIANLRQTLLTAMADNYKLILEELHQKDSLSDDDRTLMATAIVRILYYLNVILICRYQLYTYPPAGIWQEIYLLYKYAKQRNILELKVHCEFSPNKQITSILEAFTRIIMLYATDPYQWRQREQHSLNKAIELWALYPSMFESSQIPKNKVGVYILDLDQDAPPTLSNFRNAPITPSCLALDLSKGVEHLKSILDQMKSDHLKAKIEHPNDAEFSVTAPTIAKLINIWSQHITRSSQRFPITAQIKIGFGLTAAHYYINDEKEFNPHPANLRSSFGENETPRPLSASATLPVFEVSEESDEEEEPESLTGTETSEEGKEKMKTQAEVDEKKEAEANREALYHLYNYNIENISPSGFCIIIRDKTYPPFQAGEIVVFKNISGEDLPWGLGSVRWLRRKNDDEFQIGIQLIAPYAKAAGIQMVRGDKPASRLLRCLVLPESTEHKIPPMLITTTFPINSNTVMLYMGDEPVKAQLTKEIDASGMYYQYVYSTEDGVDLTQKQEKKKEETVTAAEDVKTNTEFDKIWGDL